MSADGDGAELRKVRADGYGAASAFGPRKSWLRGQGNYVRAEARAIRRRTRGVTPPSDVTVCAKTIANLGTGAVAGVVAGARKEVIRVIQRPQQGSVA